MSPERELDAGAPLEPQGELPIASRRRRARLSPYWLFPLAALLLLAYLGYRAVVSQGPPITVSFVSADGLRVEQTQVKYKNVALGTVQSIELSEGADHVLVHLDMTARAKSMLTEGARFWVVRPRMQGGALAALQTGLETLMSGSYIEIEPGLPGANAQRSFRGLEQPPALRAGENGTNFVLHADEIGSVGAGTIILHRQVPVGEVLGFALDETTGGVAIRAFIRAPYDRLVVPDTCFWNVSGLVVGMGGEGLHVEIASLRTMVSGGIAFRTAPKHRQQPPASAGHVFPLYGTQAAAEVALHGDALHYIAYFQESVNGLAAGSPVTMFGIQVGAVNEVELVPGTEASGPTRGQGKDAVKRGQPAVRVGLVLQPDRARAQSIAASLHPAEIRAEVAKGLRVVLETSSYLTGQKALSLSYVAGPQPGALQMEAGSLVLPSQTRGLDALTSSLSSVATQLEGIPFAQIGKTLHHTLRSVDRAVAGPELPHALAQLARTLDEVHGLAQDARAGLAPALERLPGIAQHVDEAVANANQAITSVGSADGEFQRNSQRLLIQATDMARSVRLLAEFLERHPEALLRGREAAKP